MVLDMELIFWTVLWELWGGMDELDSREEFIRTTDNVRLVRLWNTL